MLCSSSRRPCWMGDTIINGWNTIIATLIFCCYPPIIVKVLKKEPLIWHVYILALSQVVATNQPMFRNYLFISTFPVVCYCIYLSLNHLFIFIKIPHTAFTRYFSASLMSANSISSGISSVIICNSTDPTEMHFLHIFSS